MLWPKGMRPFALGFGVNRARWMVVDHTKKSLKGRSISIARAEETTFVSHDTTSSDAVSQLNQTSSGRGTLQSQHDEEAFIVDAAPMLFAQAFRGVDSTEKMVQDLGLFLDRIVKRRKPRYTALVIDSFGSRAQKQKTIDAFRRTHAVNGIEDENDVLNFKYKGNRRASPQSNLVGETLRILQGMSGFRFPIIAFPDTEGDDVIASLTQVALGFSANTSVSIVSPDKDFLQLLVSPRVRIFRSPRSVYLDQDMVTAQSFADEYGIEPHQFVDYLALVGDAADNIPGVMGVGKVRARKLLKEHGSLEQIITAAKEKRIRGALGAGIAASENVARLSRELVKLKCDLGLMVSQKDIETRSEVMP